MLTELCWPTVVSYKNVSKNTFIFGSSAARFDIDKGVVESGRGFSVQEDKSLAQVAVLGDKAASDLFGNEDPLGKLVRIGNYNFKVIGVYEHTGGLDPTSDGSQIVIPVTTLQKKIQGIDYLVLHKVVELRDKNIASATTLDIADVVRSNHYIKDPNKDDFKVNTQEESLSVFNTILKAITFLLIAIASISLIVGGVGVMNITDVIVTERIGEIGLKKLLVLATKIFFMNFLLNQYY